MNWPLSARTNRVLLAVTGLGLLGWLAWLNLSDDILPELEHSGGHAQRLDLATSWQYGEDGALSYRLITPEAVHLDAENRYEFQSPEAQLLDDDPAVPPWTLRASTGTLLDDGETIELVGAVQASRAPFEERGRLELTTERLWLYPEQQLALTNVPSRLRELGPDETPRWVSHADELSLDWNSRVLTQIERVHDVIQPGDQLGDQPDPAPR